MVALGEAMSTLQATKLRQAIDIKEYASTLGVRLPPPSELEGHEVIIDDEC